MEEKKSPILIARPIMPKLDDYNKDLIDIWESKWLSNSGQKHKELEEKLTKYIDSPNISLFNNGTIALMTAIQSLRLQGEVITTPFTFPATTHVLAWNNITPVFCDIDPVRLTIDPKKIERLITAKTSAILGVHVYGVPCHVEEIQEIADRHGLKVIYDGAHSFTTMHKGKPIAAYGDITMFSFHPTKLFHTGEGGALVYNEVNLKQRIEYLKNFGIKNEEEVLLPGINGKMGELQAAMGLNVLPLVKKEQNLRAKIRKHYTDSLSNVKGITVIEVPENTTSSEQYFCIRINESEFGENRDDVYERLKDNNIIARKYFYPLVSDYPCYNALNSARSTYLPVATQVAQEVLCLPFHSDLSNESVSGIIDIVFKR